VPVSSLTCVVDCAVYVEGARLAGRWSHTDALAEVRARGNGFVWIGLFEPDDAQINVVAADFGLHQPAVRDAVCAHRRPKLDHYGDTVFVVLKTLRYVENESPTTANEIVETGDVMAFLGKDFIVTVRRGQHAEMRDLRAELETTPQRLKDGPASVLHAIAGHVVDDYQTVTEACEADVDVIESLVFAPHGSVGAEQMYLLRREILELRRAVTPLAASLRRLVDVATPLVPEQVRSRFGVVGDDLSSVSERIARTDDLLTTLAAATVAKVTLRQNNDVRKISAWVGIVSVPTMGVGTYGMNFENMPGLHWQYGYPVWISLLLAVCLGLHRLFKRNGWL
jgi:magnesium transporter